MTLGSVTVGTPRGRSKSQVSLGPILCTAPLVTALGGTPAPWPFPGQSALNPRPGDLVMTWPACGCSLGLLSWPRKGQTWAERAAGRVEQVPGGFLARKKQGRIPHIPHEALSWWCCLTTDKVRGSPPLPLPIASTAEAGESQEEGTAWIRRLLPFPDPALKQLLS